MALPPDDLRFNRVILVDLMYLDGRSVMHIVDKDTLFSAAAFTNGERLEVLWRLHSAAWAQAYAGHPQLMHVDQAPQFTSPIWQGLCNSARIELVKSGVESHNALGAGERYHAYLRTIYRKVRLGHPGIDQETALSTAVAAMNQTAGPRGLAPTLLVFGILPRTPVSPLPLPTQADRMQAIVEARREMQALIAGARLRTALSAPVPAAASSDVNPGDHVLVYREPPQDEWVGPHFVVGVQDKVVWLAVDGVLRQFSVDKVKKYEPPVPVGKGRTLAPAEGPVATSAPSRDDGTTTDGALAGIGSDLTTGGVSSSSSAASPSPLPGLGPKTTTNVANDIAPRPPPQPGPTAAAVAGQDLPHRPDLPNSDYWRSVDPTVAGEAFLCDVRGKCEAVLSRLPPLVGADRRATNDQVPPFKGLTRKPTCSPRLELGKIPRPVRGVGVGVTVRNQGTGQERQHPLHTLNIFRTEVIPNGDPRLGTAQFVEAARKEADGLQERGTFTKVEAAEVPAGANVIGGRFVFTLKHVGTPQEMPKARFVAQGQHDKAKWFVVHNLATMRQRSTRVLVSTAAVLDFRIFGHDITQAYLQSQDRFSRQLYLRPRPRDRPLFDLAEDELLRIELPLYGVCDAGDYWHATFTEYIETDLNMTSLTSDQACFFKRHPDGALSGLLGAYVDDCFMVGDEAF